MRTGDPIGCLLWNLQSLTRQDLFNMLEVVKAYHRDRWHLEKRLLKCRECGHFYFYGRHEEPIGSERQQTFYIPVDDEGSADAMSRLSPFELFKCKAIRIDYSFDMKAPSEPHWCVGEMN